MSSTKTKFLMEKGCLESMHYCYLITKNILGFKKNTKEMDFQICKFLLFLVHSTMYLSITNSYHSHGIILNMGVWVRFQCNVFCQGPK